MPRKIAHGVTGKPPSLGTHSSCCPGTGMSPASDTPGEIQGRAHRCWGHVAAVSLSPRPGVSPPLPGQHFAQREVTGAIPELCVTFSNDTLRSLSSQGLPGGPSPAALLVIPSRMGCGRVWGSRVVTQGPRLRSESGSRVTPLTPRSGCSQCPLCQIQPCCGQHGENTSLGSCSRRSSWWHCPRDTAGQRGLVAPLVAPLWE